MKSSRWLGGYRGGAQVEEVLGFKLEYLELRKIAFARRVEVRLGSAEFEFDSSFLGSLRTLISHLRLPAKGTTAKRKTACSGKSKSW